MLALDELHKEKRGLTRLNTQQAAGALFAWLARIESRYNINDFTTTQRGSEYMGEAKQFHVPTLDFAETVPVCSWRFLAERDDLPSEETPPVQVADWIRNNIPAPPGYIWDY